MMARGRARTKHCGSRATSGMSLICGVGLLCLTLFTIICNRLLDGSDFHSGFGRSPFPFPDHIVSYTEEKYVSTGARFYDELRDVPEEGDSSVQNTWKSKTAEQFYSCSAASQDYPHASSMHKNGYVLIEASGGLNQQRTGITDSVVVARILNATLVVPELDHTSYWHDDSDFGDIFDVERFISAVAPDVEVIKELPLDVLQSTPVHRLSVPRQSPRQYYDQRVLQKLISRQVLKLTKFDYRLTNKLEDELQKLRCRVNYGALHFTQPIAQMGQTLVERIRRRSGRYIALHLRFEPDMLAFSGCYYGGGEQEIEELGEIRKRWRNLPAYNPERARRNGKCPLSPIEIGLLLRACGFGADSYLYVASAEVYGGEQSLAPLKALFPNFYTKETLAVGDELVPFQNYSSRMAAIDYIVCDESDVFVANNNGNMARILAGHRRFSGHKRTVRPNASKLSKLFESRQEMGWDRFAERVKHVQKGFMGDPYDGKPGKGGFHENPAACICKFDAVIPDSKTKVGSSHDGRHGGDPATGLIGSTDFEEEFAADGERTRKDIERDVDERLTEGEAFEGIKEDTKLDSKIEDVDLEENPLLQE